MKRPILFFSHVHIKYACRVTNVYLDVLYAIAQAISFQNFKWTKWPVLGWNHTVQPYVGYLYWYLLPMLVMKYFTQIS